MLKKAIRKAQIRAKQRLAAPHALWRPTHRAIVVAVAPVAAEMGTHGGCGGSGGSDGELTTIDTQKS